MITINISITHLILISLAMLIFGILYAYYIAIKPFKSRSTWVSVVIGDACTDIGTSLLIYTLTHDILTSIMPIYGHFLTGIPMILGQILKHKFLDYDNKTILAIYRNGGTNKKHNSDLS